MPPASRVAAFGFHEVTDEPETTGFQRAGAKAYTVSRQRFREYLDQVARMGANPQAITAASLKQPSGRVFLTFDDGGQSALAAAEELAVRGWTGNFFAVTSLIGRRRFLDAAGIRELHQQGHVVGSHSHSHPDIFRELKWEEMLAEWRTSMEILEDILSEPCIAASVPGGDISREVLRSADAANLRILFTSEPTIVPQAVGGCQVLGRYVVKNSTSPRRIGALSGFRGWWAARSTRTLKNIGRRVAPQLYRLYMRHRTAGDRPGSGQRSPNR